MKSKVNIFASSIYTNVGTICITASVVLMSQRVQLDQKAKDNNENIQKNINTWIKKLQAVMKENTKRVKG